MTRSTENANRRLRVLFISRRFYPEVIGGGQISALYIAKAVKSFGAEVHICTFTDKESKKEVLEGLTIHRIKIPRLRAFPRLSNMDYMYLQMARLSSKIIEDIKPDLLHLLNFESIPLSAIYFKKRYGIPIVATVSGPNFGCFTGTGRDYKRDTCINCRIFKRYLCSVHKWGKLRGSAYYLYSNWYMNMLKLSYKYVDRFFPISRAMVPVLEYMGVERHRMEIIHNPVGDIPRIDKSKLSDLKRRYGRKKIVFCASRLTEDKGIQYVIRAMKHLQSKYILLIAGKGVEENNLRKLASELYISDRVHFLGQINQQELYTYYKLASVFCHFPEIYEALGRTLIESMSVGTPVLAYPIAGIKDIVVDNKNGFLVKSRNPEIIAKKIRQVAEDRKLRSRLSKNASQTVKKRFSEYNIGKTLLRNYDNLIKI